MPVSLQDSERDCAVDLERVPLCRNPIPELVEPFDAQKDMACWKDDVRAHSHRIDDIMGGRGDDGIDRWTAVAGQLPLTVTDQTWLKQNTVILLEWQSLSQRSGRRSKVDPAWILVAVAVNGVARGGSCLVLESDKLYGPAVGALRPVPGADIVRSCGSESTGRSEEHVGRNDVGPLEVPSHSSG